MYSKFEYQKGVDLEGKRIGFGSYGSGSSAMVFSGVVQPEYKEIVKSMNLETEIGPRRRLTWNEYEELHENKLKPEESKVHTKKEFVLVDVKTDKESRGERRYVFTAVSYTHLTLPTTPYV